MVKVMYELYGCWPVVGFLYVAEFCCLKSIPVESVTSTMLAVSDIFTNESSLMTFRMSRISHIIS